MNVDTKFLHKTIAYQFLCLLLLSSLYNRELLAMEVELIDQNGEPIPNAVIGVQVQNVVSHSISGVMDQINKRFVPRVLTIQKGQSVEFPNSDNIRHHVYSFSETKPFEIRMFAGTESEHVQFEKAGIVVLGCNIHDQMVGYIYVGDGEQMHVTDSRGRATLGNNVESFYVWHERLSTSKIERELISVSERTNAVQTVQLTLVVPVSDESSKKNTFRSRKFNRKSQS